MPAVLDLLKDLPSERNGFGLEDVKAIVVGSGPIGLAIASEISRWSARVLILESGGLTRDRHTDDLDDFVDVGSPRVPSKDLPRVRTFGGTSSVWSGKCAPFDDIDFQERSWIDYSGWPIGVSDVSPFYNRASEFLGLKAVPYDESLWPLLGQAPKCELDSDLIKTQFWQYSQDRDKPRDFARFGPQFMRRLPSNVSILLNATVTNLNVSNGRFGSVDVVAPGGQPLRVAASCVVLAAGGIENARLLLLSQRSQTELGGQAIGRFLMDHPRCSIADVKADDISGIQQVFGLYGLRDRTRRRWFTHGMALSPALQRAEGLLNCSAWFTEVRSADDPWEALKNVVSGDDLKIGDLRAIYRNLPLAGKGIWRHAVKRRGVLHKCDLLTLDCFVEQRPDPASRISLADRTDRFGLPMAQIDWRIDELEKRSILRFAQIILAELKRIGLPEPDVASWIKDQDVDGVSFIDAAHPTGTTRMSVGPASGVVDKDCRMHGIDGLYIAGSSVFCTAGRANPTFMATALAIRLADHLAARYRAT